MEKANFGSTVTSGSREEEPQVDEEISRERADWTSLPPNLITKISEELPIQDRICLRAACTAWHHAVLPMGVPFPWLLVPDAESEHSDSCTFLSLPSGCFFTHSPIPELRGTRCVGSQAGWLAICSAQLDVSLLHPLTRSQIHLPSLLTLANVLLFEYIGDDEPVYNPSKEFRDHFIGKVVFASNPTCHNHIAVALYGACGEVAYTKAGKDVWLLLKERATKDHPYADVMYHDDKFYCLTKESAVQAFDLTGDCPTLAVVVEGSTFGITYFHNINLTYKRYLARSSTGELFMFLRHITQPVVPHGIELHNPKQFMVLRAHPETNPCWAATNDLGSMSLLVGTNSSILISNEHLPIEQRDCIFFIESYIPPFGIITEQRTCNVGWFHLKEESEDTYYASSSSQLDLPSVIWLTPSLQ